MALPAGTPLIPLGIRLELKEALVKRFFWFSNMVIVGKRG